MELTRSKSEKRLIRRKSFERSNSRVLAGKGLKQHMLDALIFSLAAYESTPEKVLAVLRCKYDFPIGALEVLPWEELTTDQPGPQPILVGRSAHGQVVVACRGTADFADLVADLKFVHTSLPFAKGSAHLGFVQRAASINIEPFLNLLKSGQSIVFTGHSLGGAVASLVALRVLEEATRMGCCPHQRKVQVITFGAPLFADAGLAELINTEYRELFHHIVSKNDLVPRILPLVAFGHRLLGGEPRELEYIRLGRMALQLVEHVTKWPVATALKFVEGRIPKAIRSLGSLAFRIFWPGEVDHQYSFAGQIVVLDRMEAALDKVVRLTRAEELNFWCSQLGFGLGLTPGGIAEHGLANYQKALAMGISSRIMDFVHHGNMSPETAAVSAAAAGMEVGGAVAKQMIADEGYEAKDCKVTVRCNVEVEERTQWQTGARRSLQTQPEGHCTEHGKGIVGRNVFGEGSRRSMESSRVCTQGGAVGQEDSMVLSKRAGLSVGSSRCMQCAKALKVYTACEIVVENESKHSRQRRFNLGWVMGRITCVSRQARRFSKVHLLLSGVRYIFFNRIF